MATTAMDAIRVALEREKGACRTCAEYARNAAGPAIRERFRFLPEEEKKHAKLLQEGIEGETQQET